MPDVSYVSNERITRDRYLYAAPDLAIEILSPDQNIARLLDKAHFYLLNGARLVWVIDLETETIAVLAPGAESRTLTPGDALEGGELLPGFSVCRRRHLRPDPLLISARFLPPEALAG